MIYFLLFVIIFVSVYCWNRQANQDAKTICDLHYIIETYHEGITEMGKKNMFPGCSCGSDDVNAGCCMNCCFMTAEHDRDVLHGNEIE